MNEVRPDIGELRDEHLIGDAEVRLGVVGRDGTLIAPEELDPAPIDGVATDRLEDQRVRLPGCRTPGERNAEDAVRLDRPARRRHEAVGGGFGDGAGVGQDAEPGHAAASRDAASMMAAERSDIS